MTTYSANSRQVLSMKGTASVPSFAFQGSNKTGWYLSNTNEMSATINGTQYVTINSSGAISNATWAGASIGVTYGGTGQTTYATGDILYASATNTLAKLPAGTNGYFLGLSSGVPAWLPVGVPGSVSSFSGGTTGLTPSTPTVGGIILGGILGAANGGTGLSSPGASGNFLVSTGTGWTSSTVVGSATISPTAPISPSSGNIWWDSNSAVYDIYYDDGTSSQWVQTPNNFGITLDLDAGSATTSNWILLFDCGAAA